jgi:cytochrome c oxidase accessory protein FixG
MSDFRDTLYTISKDGTRKWVYPSIIWGKIRKFRVAVATLLLAAYLATPWIEISGKQAVLINIMGREFTFFGTTYWATDTLPLVFILALLGMTLFIVSAVVGRAWCGWACPETVFLEFVFRPLEALIEGPPAKRIRLNQSKWSKEWLFKKTLKFAIYAAIAWLMANTLLAYFIGREPLLLMATHSPLENLNVFVICLIFTAAFLFQFGWFREQFCTVLCPYARFQSVLLDRASLVVGYDTKRGEPRGKAKESGHGDCVDCGLCVRVCPTGIDIRNGIQLECVHCAACIDACDSIMDGVGKPRGLIRYDSEQGFAGDKRRFIRPRLFLYLTVILILLTALGVSLSKRSEIDFQILRGGLDLPFTVLADGEIVNHLHLRMGNKGDKEHSFTISAPEAPDLKLVLPVNPIKVGAEALLTSPIFVTVQASSLEHGHRKIELVATREDGKVRKSSIVILGPG